MKARAPNLLARRLPRGVLLLGLSLGSASCVGLDSFLGRPAALLVEIRPEKSTWEIGETIRGSIVLRNVGRARVKVSYEPSRFPSRSPVDLLDANGNPAPHTPSRLGIILCGVPTTVETPVLRPGEEYAAPFEIHTDPLTVQAWRRVEQGRYHLAVPELLARLQVPATARAARIDVVRSVKVPVGSRILDFACGKDRIVILRESGSLESFEISSRRRLARTTLRAFSGVDLWPSGSRFSSDAKLFARPRHKHQTIELFVIEDDSIRQETLGFPEGVSSQNRRVHVNPRGILVTGKRGTTSFEWTLATAEWRPVGMPFSVSDVSEDGQHFLIHDPERGIGLAERAPGRAPSAPQRSAQPDDDGVCWLTQPRRFYRKRAWRSGIYLLSSKRTLVHSYDECEPDSPLKFPGRPLCESHDGAYVAFMGPPPPAGAESDSRRVVIQSTHAPAQAVELPGSRGWAWSASFAAEPTRLVGSRRLDGDGSTARWIHHRFEVYDPRSGEVVDTFDLRGDPTVLGQQRLEKSPW